MRAVLEQIRQERGHCETLVKSARASLSRIQEMGGPIAKAEADMAGVSTRLAGLEQRLGALDRVSAQFQTLDERAERLGQGQRQAETRVAHAVEDAQRIRSLIEELSHKVDLALDLKDRLGTFLEMEAPLRQLQGDAEGMRGAVGTLGEQVARIRGQHDRVMEAHKTALSKFEAFDHRHEELTRQIQDRERRVAAVEQALRGMDEVRDTVDDAKRRLGTLKALGDYVAQKTAALEAQREAVERAAARADQLDQAMRQVDAGVRQQQEHARTLAELQEQLAGIQAQHQAVFQQSREAAEIRQEIDGHVREAREELGAARDELRKSVERFDFENRALESVTQRVADLRAAVSGFEARFQGLSESGQLVTELTAQTQSLTARLQQLTADVGRLDDEARKVQAIRRDLDETGRSAREAGERLARLEEARPGLEAALRDVEQLRGTHAMVKDGLEQTRIAAAEITRVREDQAQTRSWLGDVQQGLAVVQERADELRRIGPTLEFVQKQVQRVNESISNIESRREFVDDLQRRVAELGAQGAKLDERGRELDGRMEAAEQRFVGLAAQADEAERLGKTITGVTTALSEAERDAERVGKIVAAVETRCESVEGLAERTRALREEIEQRAQAVDEATRNLQRASELRQESAAAAQDLDERAKRLGAALAGAERQATRVETMSTELEDRAGNLRFVEKRLGQFEERLARWDLVEQEIGRSLDQLVGRQSTVEALQTDLDRMFLVAEKTATDVRTITAAQAEIAGSRTLLEEVMGRLRETSELASSLDERRRQTAQAEERLARAEALLIDVRSSLEALQGQKVIVDQAVEKAGALRFLIRQAEGMIDGLREERDMAARVRAAVSSVQGDVARAG
jgi:chromosome segregation ATPase